MTDTLAHKPMEDLNSIYNIPSGIDISIIKKETHSELPELGDSGNIVINSDCESTNSGVVERPGENIRDPDGIQECLAVNQALQRQFVAILIKIQSSLERNVAKQEKLMGEAEETTVKTTKQTSQKSAKLFCFPYFRDVRGLVPPENEDTILKSKNRDINAYVQPPRPWSDEEKNRLLNGVLASALDFVLRKHKAKRDFLKSKLTSPELSDEEKKEVKKSIKGIERQIVEEQKRSPEDLLKEADGNIDWLKVSATDLEGGRSEDDCEIMWNNYLSIFVNKKPFTKDEDKRLEKLAKSHNHQNWDGVAQLLGTQRSAIQCIERYQTELNKDLVRSYWGPKEDEKLLETIENVRVGNFIPWNQVLLYMEGRARHQIITRYERTLKGSLDRGPWSKYEDAMLTLCVAKFGTKWSKMQGYFPHRTPYHTRERYVNHLDSSLKIGNWTREDDLKLAESISKYGYKWSKIAAEMPGRTDNMCLTRFKRIVLFLESKNRDLRKMDKKEPDFLLKHLPQDERMPSHICKRQNNKLKSTQSAALEVLTTAIDNVSASFPKDIGFDKTDFSSFNIQMLERLYKELKRLEAIELEETGTIQRPKRCTLPLHRRYRAEGVDHDGPTDYEISPYESESEEQEETEPEPELDLKDYEVLWLHKVLETKLQEECASYEVVPLREVYKKSSYILPRNLEYRFYVEYLRKELFLPYSIDLKDENDEKNFEQINITLNDMVRHFIQPKVSANEVMILAPNRSTLLGMDRILASKPRLQRTAHFVEHSTSYIRYLTGSKMQPLCLKCSSQKIKKENASESYQDTVKEMKAKLLVVDETFDEAARLETRNWPEEEDACLCSALIRSKDQVDLLMKRFVSLFFLPFFLSTVPIPHERDEILITEMRRQPMPTPKVRKTGPIFKSKKRVKKREQKPKKEPVQRKRRPSPGPPMRKSKRLCALTRDSFREPDEED